MKIEVLGPGCAKCKRLAKNVEKALKKLRLNDPVIKVEDMDEIIDHGVMMTPALFIDGEAKAVGRVPSVNEIEKLLKA